MSSQYFENFADALPDPARLEEEKKKLEDAVSELLKVDILYAYPEWSAAALFEAGRCFEEMGDPIQARKRYEEVQLQHDGTEWADRASRHLKELNARTLPGH